MKLTLVWRSSLCISAPSHSKLICDAKAKVSSLSLPLSTNLQSCKWVYPTRIKSWKCEGVQPKICVAGWNKKAGIFSQAIRYSLIWFDVPIQDRTWSSLEQRIWLPPKLKADMMQAGIWSGTCLDLGSPVDQIQSLQNPLLSFLTSNNCVIICCRLITIFGIWLGTAAGWDLQNFFLFLNAEAFLDFQCNHYNNEKFLIVIQM